MKPTLFPTLLAAVALAGCSNSNSPNYTPPAITPATFSALGDSATIAAKLDEFRTALGGSLHPPAVPAQDSGRREINWDGVPPALTNVDTFPATFFSVTSTRGALYSGPGTGFRVDSTGFGAINAGLAAQFKPFSAKKLFASVGSNVTEVFFDLVKTQTPGLVKGFGVVFTDVDRAGSTHVKFRDQNDVVLADLTAPARAGTQEFSFVGAVFPTSIVRSVVITSGDAALDGTVADLSAGGTKDLVVMDDFAYGEPRPLP
ncbi:MAG: hypothetical protein ACREMO_04570 [Gemmatimonadales bacterium]